MRPVFEAAPYPDFGPAYPFAVSSDCQEPLRERAAVRFGWSRDGLYVFAELEDSCLIQTNRADEQLHYHTGDVLELFVKPLNASYKWEMYVTPFGNKSTLFFPERPAGCSPEQALREHDFRSLDVSVEQTSNGWTAQLFVPVEQLTALGAQWGKGTRWTLLCGRYNYGSDDLSELELSMSPALSATDYHLVDEYALLQFADKKACYAVRPEIRSPHPWAENHIVMWMEKFGRQVQAAREMPDCELLFVGDSITEHWLLDEWAGDLWNRHYGPRKAVNAGSGGDCTEHILWRLENGILEQITPKLVVLMAGTNNTGHRKDSPRDICRGIRALIDCIHSRSPKSRVLLHAIFPRGRDAADPDRRSNEAANRLIETMAGSYSFVKYMDINAVFLDEKDVLSEDIMPDLLHPAAAGYERWAAAIETEINLRLGEPA